jgi:hypothetical protein
MNFSFFLNFDEKWNIFYIYIYITHRGIIYKYLMTNTHLIAFERCDKCPWRYLILKLSLRASLIGKELLFTSGTPKKKSTIISLSNSC